ncbi:MAG: MinD/ParA family protein [Thermodesulfovibrionales bacterium]|nr:MinD/ParA family protein [Thermodesulfovibrionales bacterium]
MSERAVKTISITSGKGGVGKTNIVAALAIAMRRLGRDVMIFDADLGLSNIDVLLHLAPKYNIQHLLRGEKTLSEIIIDGPFGVKIIPAGSGIQELTALNEFQRLKIMESFDSYDGKVDVLLIDTPAGISENVAFFCTSSEEIVVITSPEPTAITDAYAIIKVLFTRYQEKDFHIIVNSAKDKEEALEIFDRLSLAAERFLNISLNYLGYIPLDDAVKKSVMVQRSFADLYPGSPATKAVMEIAEKLLEEEVRIKGGLQFFIRNLIGGLREKSLCTVEER